MACMVCLLILNIVNIDSRLRCLGENSQLDTRTHSTDGMLCAWLAFAPKMMLQYHLGLHNRVCE